MSHHREKNDKRDDKDAVLKDLLKEAKRRERNEKNEKSDKSDRSEKRRENNRGENKGEKESEKEKQERRERRERKHKEQEKEQEERKGKGEKINTKIEEKADGSDSEEIREVTKDPNENIQSALIDDGIDRFLFIFEDNNDKLYDSLEKIEKIEGIKARIFPVFFTGCNDNLTEETVTFIDGNWTPDEENKETSWLNIIKNNGQKINDRQIEIITFEPNEIVIYNNNFFHCIDDILDYLQLYGPDVMPVNH